ncbi:FHA domain-containing protein [Heliobacterium gestii]|uniref:FHA domain-containing protein n=1 Tax=Heliomicrobium gestii TaxID=2699 RepID=A0A845LBK5_HELGE|nr:FHA domain-containing protein [Heliomicrobium gestii]MBM7865645.1 hypothetical protein [Heliomicrobium gestii]MZP41895.1 FHA domain-containing protein [Heliomicrobium gestii]
MNEFRVCEFCGRRNQPDELECAQCGADLSYVSPTVIADAAEEQQKPSAPSATIPVDQPEVPTPVIVQQLQVMRIGDGQTAHPRLTGPDQCLPQNGASAGTLRLLLLRLRNPRDGMTISIPVEGGVFGRSGAIAPGYFADKPYVSGTHAKVYPKGNGYVLLDERSTNGTRINGRMVERGREEPIRPGDRLTLANIDFIVEVDEE